MITYEQPLNEHIRVCLRLEHLFHLLTHYLQDQTIAGSRTALATLLDIASVTDRPDLRNKLSRALSHYANLLTSIERASGVDSERVKEILYKLDTNIDALHQTHGRFGQGLRTNEFLNSIRMHQAKPGGICDFNFPAYHLWLQQPPEQRVLAITEWLKEFEQLRIVINLILQLTRDSTTAITKTASQGFYQETLSPAIHYQMIRVSLPGHLQLYPEISVGRHRLAIYFFSPNFTGNRIQQCNQDIEFQLSCCAA